MGRDEDTSVCSRRSFLKGVAGASAVTGCGADAAVAGHRQRPLVDGSSGAGRDEDEDEDEVEADRARRGREGFGGTGEGDESGSSGVYGERPDPDPPNIILITLDDVGWTTLPQYGNPHIETPAFDALAQQGILFRNAFLTTSSCSPSRGVYLTGQYPHTNGLIGLAHRYPEFALQPGIPTLPEWLRSSGYATCIQGKWHVGPSPPTEFGFDLFLNDITGTKKIQSAQHAVEFIQEHADRPFYLELNFVEPHLRWAEHKGFELVGPDVEVLEHWMMPNWPEIQELAARYYGEVWYVDSILVELLAALAKLGLEENTLIAVISDNGAPFPGNKQTLYDRGIGTPLIMRWPRVIEPGRVSDELFSAIDLPQAFALASAQQKASFMQGERYLFDHLGDPAVPGRDAIYSQMSYHSKYIPTRSIRADRWKYIRNLTDEPWGLGEQGGKDWAQALLELPGHDWDQPRPHAELYDLHADPHEVNDLVDDPAYAEIRDELHARLLELAAESGDDVEL